MSLIFQTMQVRRTRHAGYKKTKFFFSLLPIETQVLANSQKLIFINIVWTLDVHYRTYQVQCMIAMNGTIYQPLRSGRIWHKVNF